MPEKSGILKKSSGEERNLTSDLRSYPLHLRRAAPPYVGKFK